MGFKRGTLPQALGAWPPQIPADAKKKPALLGLVFQEWCRKPESNRHGVLHRQILNLLRLPISPLRQEGERELWHSAGMTYPTIEDAIGHTPLVALQRIGAQNNAERGNVILGKLEGNNPAGSVKDRPAKWMIKNAVERGTIPKGARLIEPTSGNTGIALAMMARAYGVEIDLALLEALVHLDVDSLPKDYWQVCYEVDDALVGGPPTRLPMPPRPARVHRSTAAPNTTQAPKPAPIGPKADRPVCIA